MHIEAQKEVVECYESPQVKIQPLWVMRRKEPRTYFALQLATTYSETHRRVHYQAGKGPGRTSVLHVCQKAEND